MIPLFEVEEARREFQEFNRRFEQQSFARRFESQYFAPRPDRSSADRSVRLLERIGDRLIAFGTRLKARSHSAINPAHVVEHPVEGQKAETQQV